MQRWERIAFESARPEADGGLTDDDGVALERRLEADANDIETRVRLVGFYFLRLTTARRQRHAQHLTWLAKHRPDIGLSGFGFVEEDEEPEAYESLRLTWMVAASAPDAEPRAIENAATFLYFGRPEEAEPLVRRLVALEPNNAEWRRRLAQTLLRLAEWAKNADDRRRHARAAVEELTPLTAGRDDDALGDRIDLARAAGLAENWKRVVEAAERVLVDCEAGERTFQYGNAIHHANIALGHAALANADLAKASEYLIPAGKTPGSPQLNSFGPDFVLATKLLDRGERAAVLKYLEDCASFWKGHADLLAEWRRAIARGERPPFCDDD